MEDPAVDEATQEAVNTFIQLIMEVPGLQLVKQGTKA